MRIAYIIGFILLTSLVAVFLFLTKPQQSSAPQTLVEGDENSRKLWNNGGWIGDVDQQFESIRVILSDSIDAQLSSMENLTRAFIVDQGESISFDPYKSDSHGWHQYIDLSKKVPCEDSQPNPERWCDTYYSLEETAQVQKEIYDIQHPEDCRSGSAILLRTDYVSNHGLGTFVHVFSTAVAEAFQQNRVLLNAAEWRFSNRSTCARYSLDCLFWPVSHCISADTVTENQLQSIPASRLVPPNANISTIRFQTSTRDFIPEKYRKKDLHWWRAQLTKYILRPRPSLIELTALLQADVFPYGHAPRPLISLHVRHGGMQSPLVVARSYIWAIERKELREKYQAKSIFVTTEDPEVITELKAEFSGTFDFYYVNMTRTNLEWNEMVKYIGADREAALAFAQLFISVQADFFVGTRSSHWCRLIDELRKANGKARTPYLSPVRDREAEW